MRSAGGREGWTRRLELDAGCAVRQLQLPVPGPVLDPVPERDSVPGQPQVLLVSW